jgi:hypothetical protein
VALISLTIFWNRPKHLPIMESKGTAENFGLPCDCLFVTIRLSAMPRPFLRYVDIRAGGAGGGILVPRTQMK